MTDDQIDKLANAIVLKMMAKQEEYDKQFLEDVKVLVEDGTEIKVELSNGKNAIQNKINELKTLLAKSVDDQDFLKAKRISDEIDDLEKKYNL